MANSRGRAQKARPSAANTVIQGTLPEGGRRSGMQVRLAWGARRSWGSPRSVPGSRVAGRALATPRSHFRGSLMPP